ncbi:MAG: FecR domain-containing protein [Gallionella sp.]|nr:FecR domain-containing protein [Gallionella sp.]
MKSNLLKKLVLCILLAVLPIAESFAAAGKFNFVIGDVRIVGATGERKAEKGGEIEASETIVSGADGIAQLRMSDGAFIAVRANTELRIDQHQYNGKPDESSSTVLSLVKGTFRAFTGAIASFNKDNFKMKTPGATIGIRGSGNVLNFSPNNNVTLNHTIEGSHTITAVDPSGVMRTLVTMPGQTVQVNPAGVMQFVPTPAFILNAATAAADTKPQQQKEQPQQQSSDKKDSDKQSSESKEQATGQSGESKPSSESKQQGGAPDSAGAASKADSTAGGDGAAGGMPPGKGAGQAAPKGTAGGAPGTAGGAPGTAGGAPGTAGGAPGTAGGAPGTAGGAPGTAGGAPGMYGTPTPGMYGAPMDPAMVGMAPGMTPGMDPAMAAGGMAPGMYGTAPTPGMYGAPTPGMAPGMTPGMTPGMDPAMTAGGMAPGMYGTAPTPGMYGAPTPGMVPGMGSMYAPAMPAGTFGAPAMDPAMGGMYAPAMPAGIYTAPAMGGMYAPAMPAGAFGAPAMDPAIGGMNAPAMPAGTYTAPAMGGMYAPAMPAGTFGAPAMGPAMGGMNAPAMPAGTYTAPAMGGMYAPAMPAGTYTAPTYTAPTYTAPTYTAPTYTAPTYTAPTYTNPIYTNPYYWAYDANGNLLPGYTLVNGIPALATTVAGGACTGAGTTSGSLYCNGTTWITPTVGTACTGAATVGGFTCSAGFWVTSGGTLPVGSIGGTCTGYSAPANAYCSGGIWVTTTLQQFTTRGFGAAVTNPTAGYRQIGYISSAFSAGNTTEVGIALNLASNSATYITSFEQPALPGSAAIGAATQIDFGLDTATGMSWGRWQGNWQTYSPNQGTVTVGANSNLHWFATPVQSQAVILPLTGTFTYTKVGGTTPTDNYGTTGTLNSATFAANFSNQTVDVGVNVSMPLVATSPSVTIDAKALNVPILPGANFVSTTPTLTCTGCTTTPTGVIGGQFSGATGAGAGVGYGLQQGTQIINGVVVFKR